MGGEEHKSFVGTAAAARFRRRVRAFSSIRRRSGQFEPVHRRRGHRRDRSQPRLRAMRLPRREGSLRRSRDCSGVLREPNVPPRSTSTRRRQFVIRCCGDGGRPGAPTGSRRLPGSSGCGAPHVVVIYRDDIRGCCRPTEQRELGVSAGPKRSIGSGRNRHKRHGFYGQCNGPARRGDSKRDDRGHGRQRSAVATSRRRLRSGRVRRGVRCGGISGTVTRSRGDRGRCGCPRIQ
mmetsp:Transcript_12956/g.40209  ORF Transcript_12956/g.40209 Transcript_12956/m.40209 type:complete len:234 (+) Transcript_12956:134-835(+)